MSESFHPSMTPFDSCVQSEHMQLMKASIPYMPSASQKLLSCYIKYVEFANTLNSFRKSENDMLMCSVAEPISPMALLEHLREFCSAKEAETVDTILNTVKTFQMITSIQSMMNHPQSENADRLEQIKSNIPDEQYQLFTQLFTLLQENAASPGEST